MHGQLHNPQFAPNMPYASRTQSNADYADHADSVVLPLSRYLVYIDADHAGHADSVVLPLPHHLVHSSADYADHADFIVLPSPRYLVYIDADYADHAGFVVLYYHTQKKFISTLYLYADYAKIWLALINLSPKMGNVTHVRGDLQAYADTRQATTGVAASLVMQCSLAGHYE